MCAHCCVSAEDVEGLDALRWEDQQMIRDYAEAGGGGGGGSAVAQIKSGGNAVYGVEVAQASRATCKHCSQKIMKGEVFLCFFGDLALPELLDAHFSCS